jgi:hypothetical protein
MATFRVTLTSTALRTDRIRSTKGRFYNIRKLLNILRGFLSSAYSGTITIWADASATAATATATLASVANNDTLTIGNVTFTAKTSGPTGNQWLVGVSDTADAAAFCVVINAHAVLSKYLVATSALGVVTLTAIGKGLGDIANLIALSSSNGTRLAVVAFASGAEDTSAVTHTF